MMKLSRVVAAVAAAMLLAAPALAQVGRGDAPVEITSLKGEYFEKEGRGVYTGNVVASQGDARITTDKLTIFCKLGERTEGGPACDQIQQLIAEGNVFYTAQDVKIRGTRASYDYPTDTITITGDVILSRGTDGVVRGTQVVYSVGEGRTVITAGEKRVFTVFTPKKKEDKPAAPAAPAAQRN